MSQENIRQDVNGSTDKPFPQERNWVRNDDPDGKEVVPSITVPQMATGIVHNQFGQIKYARREGAKSIYKDPTRQTENDKMASKKAESSTLCEVEDEKFGEENY